MGGYRLEEFLGDLLKRMERVPGANPRLVASSRNGTSGQAQGGVDHRGEYSDGTRGAWQCKEQQTLAKGDIDEIITDMAKAGETAQRRIIVFSRIASPTARAEIAKHAGWEIWDQADLGDRVRSLLVQDARALLDTHFGAQFRRRFLPIAGTDAFLPLETFFEPLLNKDDRFHHAAPLVGREADLDAIVTALTDPAGPRVVIVEGPAGLGKSRLVLDALRQVENKLRPVPVLVRAEGHVLNSGALDELPVGPTILLAEDAHRDPRELEALLGYARRTEGVRVVLTVRWFGRAAVEQAAVAAQFALTELMMHALTPLTATAARQLVTDLQGDGLTLDPVFAEQLAQAARATPFVAIVAVAMIRRGELSTALTLDKNLQREVMARYGQVATEGIPGVTAHDTRRLLALIAALSPVDLGDEPLVDAMAQFLSTNRPTLLGMIQTLTEHGALLDRERVVRVIPDLLADEILAGEAVMMGVDTGFVGQVWQAFPGQRAVLVPNLAGLDWRIRQSAELDDGAVPPDVFGPIWTDFRAQFMAADHQQRCAALDWLAVPAAAQSSRVLAVLQGAVATPGPAVPGGAGPWTHDDVCHGCARLIETCAQSDAGLLSAAFDLLWELSRDDDRSTNQEPDHPVRVMERLASLGAPDALNTAHTLVDRVTVWLAQTDNGAAPVRTPLFALEPLLAKEGTSQQWQLDAIAFRIFIVDPGEVGPLRDRIRQLLAPIIAGPDVACAVEAVRLLGEALHEPSGYFGRTVPAETILAWEDDDLQTVAVLQTGAQATSEPLVRCEIRTAVSWHAELAASAAVQEASRALLAVLNSHDEDLLTELLATGDFERVGLADADPCPEAAETPDSSQAATDDKDISPNAVTRYEQVTQRRQQDRVRVAEQLWEAAAGPEHLVTVLAERLTVSAAVRTEPAPGLDQLLRAVIDARPDAAADLFQAVTAAPPSPLDHAVAVILDALLKRDQDAFLPALRAAVGSRPSLAIGALHGFTRAEWRTVAADAAPIITGAIDHPRPPRQPDGARKHGGLAAGRSFEHRSAAATCGIRPSGRRRRRSGRRRGHRWPRLGGSDDQRAAPSRTRCPRRAAGVERVALPHRDRDRQRPAH